VFLDKEYVCKTFTVYMKTRKILEISAPIFVGTLGTLDQHEFAFGFSGCIGVEISRVRGLVAGGKGGECSC